MATQESTAREGQSLPSDQQPLSEGGAEEKKTVEAPRVRKSLTYITYHYYLENSWRDYLDAAFMFLVALGQRLFRLEHPNELVFDEVGPSPSGPASPLTLPVLLQHYFGKFTNYTHAGTYYFDIHPRKQCNTAPLPPLYSQHFSQR